MDVDMANGMASADPSPSSPLTPVAAGDTSLGSKAETSRAASPEDEGSSSSVDKGKGKEVDRSLVRVLELPLASTSAGSSTSSNPDSMLSPRSTSPRLPSLVKADRLPSRRRTNTATDSSDQDTVSSAPLPLGKPLPERIPSPSKEGPPAKKARATGPTPLPTGPPTINTIRILLEPEHVDMNRPKQLFDLIRTRDALPPRVRLAPMEIKEILEKMRRVNEIWLRTMGEDEGNVQCLAGWLRLFVGSKEPKQYEGIVAPAIWVVLKAKPPIQILRTTRFGTLAKQALEKAKLQGLSRKDDIEKAVSNFDHLIELAKKNSVPGTGPSSTSADASKKALPSFKKTASSSALPSGNDGAGRPSASSSSASIPQGSSSNPTTTAPRPSIKIPSVAEMTDLQKILAGLPSYSKLASTPAAATGSNAPIRANPASDGPPFKRVKVEDTGRATSDQSQRLPSRSGGGSSSLLSGAFRTVGPPAPLTINRPSSSAGTSSAITNNSAQGSDQNSYPSQNNRWSSVATPEGMSRPYDNQKRPNWRNRTLRYRPDNDLAHAREFEQDEGEEEHHPTWWIYGRHFAQGNTSGQLDKEEGHSMKHVHGHEPAIEWYDPQVYDTTGSTVEAVNTFECQQQDTRERPLLSTFYHSKADIPHCPDETGVQAVNHEYGMIYIPPVPRAYIPPPQPMPYNPWAQAQNRPPAPSGSGYGINNGYNPPTPAPAPSGSTSSSFRPRNGSGQTGPSNPSSAYRPRATSAPALDQKPDLPAPNMERQNSLPTVPKIKIKLGTTNSAEKVYDREGVIRHWRREMRPRKSALLNPLSREQVEANLARMAAEPPFDYGKCNLGGEGDDEGGS